MRIIDTPAYRRHMRCRHALTLDLFTRTGNLWALVSNMRAKWGISAEEGIPPRLTGGNANNPWESPSGFYYPKEWPAKPFGWLLAEPPEAPSNPLRREGYELVWRGTWWEDVSALAKSVVPAECLGDGLFRADPFVSFLASCVLFDPPREKLLDFADAAHLTVMLPPVTSADLSSGSIAPASPVAMFQPPIVARQDPNALKQAVVDWYEALIAAMANSLRSQGIDLSALRQRLAARPEHSDDQLARTLRRLPNEHYIQVRPETGREEVLGAYKLMRARYPGPPAKKDERSDLMCVQIALWRAAGRSEADIAEHFKWMVQQSDAEAPRSKVVRDCAKRGRAVLEERGFAA